MIKLKKLSHRYTLSFQILFYVIILGLILFWITYRTPYDIFTNIGIGANLAVLIQSPLSLSTRILAFIVSIIPCSVILYGLNQLIKLFKNYERGEVFTNDNVQRYKKLAYSLFAWVIAGICYDALISLVLSFNNPPGQRVISINFEGPDFVALVAGAVVLTIAYVMQEAHKLSDENKFTI